MLIEYRGGPRIVIGGVTVSFDSAIGGLVSCISHAHMDHKKPDSVGKNIMTTETYEILSVRGARFKNELLPSSYNKRVKVSDELKITAFNAGHMLGSSMFLVESDEGTLLYTGDINTEGTLIDDPAKPIESDFLLIEATYGDPKYKFMRRDEIYASIVKWIVRTLREGNIPAFKVYAAGKAQELVALINETLKTPVMVDRNVGRVSSVYRRYYSRMEFFPLDGPEAREVMRGGEFVIVSSTRFARRLSTRRVKWAVATGWAHTRTFPSYERAFPLSAHDDFYRLMDFVEAVNPRFTFTVYGFSRIFARYLATSGRHAMPLDWVGRSFIT